MRFSKNLIGKFVEAHKRRFGLELSEKEAERDLSMLATLVKIISKSINNAKKGVENGK